VTAADNMDDAVIEPEVLEAFSHVIVTAVEGGSYTRDDYKEWTQYAHADGPFGFQAAVTVYPNRVGRYDQDAQPDPVRVTADWFAKRIVQALINTMGTRYSIIGHNPKAPVIPKALYEKAMKLALGDEDVAGEIDVIDAGALLQIAVYGDVIYG
jgi:hypothetical protein